MAEQFDGLLQELEQSVMEDMREVYSAKTIDHFLNPKNLGAIPAPDGFGRLTGSCGDTMEIGLKVTGGRVTNASFWTDGCGPSIASGSVVTELAKGKEISEAQKITQQDVLAALGGLPEESLHCALLAADTLKEAIKDYRRSRENPGKELIKNGEEGR
jgi:nitrogen fixation protein NifU and related proteins